MIFKGNSKEEYEMIVVREKEMKERIQHDILIDNYEDWNTLLETMELRHRLEVKAAYEKGIQQGAYYQRIIDCKEDMTEFIGKKADE